ncbi:tetratricopeptide repeat protein [Desulfatibacillum aliphaticivorans]|uniref:tetratricopeptide repeat protein n=1 Tax=Desulfatibacillum aliphaticivorans TaxID=218208 RepID=UPI0003F4DA81|nr:tetratricopeptide repeat protein [Desulfatibacillum aliphaticivorans]
MLEGGAKKLSREWGIGMGLVALAVLMVYYPAFDFSLISAGDYQVIFGNPIVRSGLSMEDLPQIFALESGKPWGPLAAFAHAAVFRIFKDSAAAHHLVNMGVHLINSWLVLLILSLSTGDKKKSILTALFFAILPVSVGAAAWIAQLRALLCAMFCLAGVFLYVLKKGEGGRRWLAAVLLCHVSALLCGPEAIAFPVMLVILDYWPLGRMDDDAGLKRLFREKTPLLIASAMGMALALIPYRSFEWNAGITDLFYSQLGHLSYCLKTIFSPEGLTIFYPYFVEPIPYALKIFQSVILLMTWLIYKASEKRPALWAGWLWFLLVPFGTPFWLQGPAEFIFADWHVYLPSIGLIWAVVWLFPSYEKTAHFRTKVLALILIAALIPNYLAARDYLNSWKNDREAFMRNLHFYLDYPPSLVGLGNWLTANGYEELAFSRFYKAVEVDPGYAPAHYYLANALAAQGDYSGAEAHYREALRLKPGAVRVLSRLGALLIRMGRPDEAVPLLEKALRADPAGEEPLTTLAGALASLDMLHQAEKYYRTAMDLHPDSGAAAQGLAEVLVRTGRPEEAAPLLENNLAMGFNKAETHFSLGDVYLQMRDYPQAASQFRMAIAEDPGLAKAHNSLGAVLLMMGRKQEAMEQFSKALDLDPNYAMARKNLEYVQKLISGGK